MGFLAGDVVEVASNEEGYYGSYWEATVVAKKNLTNQYLVEYKTLWEENFSRRLREVVPLHDVRPVPIKCPVVRYRYGDRVDAFDRDGWWVGTITGMNEDEGRYYVYFEPFKVGIMYDVNRIRMHQDWNEEKWSAPSKRGYPCNMSD